MIDLPGSSAKCSPPESDSACERGSAHHGQPSATHEDVMREERWVKKAMGQGSLPPSLCKQTRTPPDTQNDITSAPIDIKIPAEVAKTRKGAKDAATTSTKEKALLTKDAMLKHAARLGVHWRTELKTYLLSLPYKNSKDNTGLNSWAVSFGVLTQTDKVYREKGIMAKEIIENLAQLMAQTSDASTKADAPGHRHERDGTDDSDGDGNTSDTGPGQGGSAQGQQSPDAAPKEGDSSAPVRKPKSKQEALGMY